MAHLLLHVSKHLPGIGLIPAPIQLLSGQAKLDDEVAGEVLWLDLAALFSPEPEEGTFIAAYDDPSDMSIKFRWICENLSDWACWSE